MTRQPRQRKNLGVDVAYIDFSFSARPDSPSDHGGHHGPDIPKVPDWRLYRVEEVPELMELKKALECHGLKDPWLRNEVWRYEEYGPLLKPLKLIIYSMKHGFKYGGIAGIITAGIEYAFFPIRKLSNQGDEHH